MTAPITEADREAARGLLDTDDRGGVLNYYDTTPQNHYDGDQKGIDEDVETAAQVIADAREAGAQAERDERLQDMRADPNTEADREAARTAMGEQSEMREVVERVARAIADARKRERDAWIAAAEPYSAMSDGICGLLCDMGEL